MTYKPKRGLSKDLISRILGAINHSIWGTCLTKNRVQIFTQKKQNKKHRG